MIIRNLLATSLLLLTVSAFGQDFDPSQMRDRLNEWHLKHNKIYLDNEEENGVAKRSEERTNKTTSQQGRIEHNCELKFLSGANVAWNNYANDLGAGGYNSVFFESMFTDLENSGGNVMRLWLHTNGVNSPMFTNGGDPNECTGMNAQQIADLVDICNRAENHNVQLQLCLWTHNMLQSDSQWNMTQQVRDRNRAMLEDSVYCQHYIDNALLPMVNALQGHPAILAWEVFNEPEGMCNGIPHHASVGWTYERTEFNHIQRFINQVAGAIHRADTTAKVTNGAWDFESTTDVDGNVNYYKDNLLIAAGNDPDGYLDFYTVHYYDWALTAHSPFHHDVSYWQLDKPLVVAEFYVENTFGVDEDSLFIELYERGYAGGYGWHYKDNWGDIGPSIQEAHNKYASDIDYKSGACANSSAGFIANKTQICEDDTVIFTDESLGDVIEWEWDFGSAASPGTASGSGPHEVIFSSAGNKDVKLITTSASGADSTTKDGYITVQAPGNDEVQLTYFTNGACGIGANYEPVFTPNHNKGSDHITISGTSDWSTGNVIAEYSIDVLTNSVTPSDFSQLGSYIYGTWQSAKGSSVAFDITYYTSGTAYIDVASVSSSGTHIIEIFIDGVSQGTHLFSGPDIFSINVPEGSHEIQFKAVGQDWLEVNEYGFSGMADEGEYLWFLNNSFTGVTTEIYSPNDLTAGDQVFLKTKHNQLVCIDTLLVSDTITVGVCTGIIDGDKTEIEVNPNPFNDELNIIGINNELFTINIFSVNGVQLYHDVINADSYINTSHFQNGFYLVEVYNSKQHFRYKLVKQ